MNATHTVVMATPVSVTVVYRESGSSCDETPVRNGTSVSREAGAYNAFQFSLVSRIETLHISFFSRSLLRTVWRLVPAVQL